ncbi:MAG: hypothetical protein ACK5MZ_05735 [Aestuariibaculum sp.]
MKKLILIIASIMFVISNINAANENPIITKSDLILIFNWKAETEKGIYSGTSSTLQEAREIMLLASSGELITGTEITSYYILKSEANSTNRNYFWEVDTVTGRARGYSSSLDYAHKMIALVASGDAIVSKIIISQPAK